MNDYITRWGLNNAVSDSDEPKKKC